MALEPVHILGVAAGIGDSWRTRLLVETALHAAGAEAGITTQLLDLSQTPVQFAANLPLDRYDANTQAAVAAVQRAQGFIFGSPIYRAAYTGVFKNFFDLLPVEALVAKVAGLVATGASDHHYLAPDIVFRPVLTFFNMHTVPGVLYARSDEFVDRAPDATLAGRAQTLGRDLVTMTRALSGRAYGPPSPGVASVRLPPPGLS